MKNLNSYILNLDLSADERNAFSQMMRGSKWDKHFKNLSTENLLKLKKIFECKKKQCSLITSIMHCDYALRIIEEALSLKN